MMLTPSAKKSNDHEYVNGMHNRQTKRGDLRLSMARHKKETIATSKGTTPSSEDNDHILRFQGVGQAPALSPAARRGLDWALEFAARYSDASTGDILHEWTGAPYHHATLYAAFAYLVAGDPARAKALLRRPEVMRNLFNTPVLVVMLKGLDPLLDDETRQLVLNALRTMDTTGAEDIIAGRNINIPMLAWTARIAQGVLFGKPDLVAAGRRALERLTDLVAAHGSIPEFNCPSYDVATLTALRAIVLLDEPETSRLAARLERHLWEELAWRYHPNLRVAAGPWGRAYQSDLIGGASLTQLMLHIAWDALFDPAVAYPYHLAHGHLHGAVLPVLLETLPFDVREVALDKQFPLAVTSSSEQVLRKLGDDEHRTWVPGGIADLATWMDEHLAVGTASRSHVHGLQNATYLAQWTRTGNRVLELRDLGQAFTRFTTNGKRPGDAEYHYHNHQRGGTFTIGPCLWGDDGRPFALQSGPTALVLYQPKAQERWNVRTMEMMVVAPRLDTIDEVLVDGAPVRECEGPAGASVVVRSGRAALGMRFAVCDPDLVAPRMFVERKRDHLLVGLRLIEYDREQAVPEDAYMRLGGCIGIELRYAPSKKDVAALVHDMRDAEISDAWDMADIGGPREVSFRVGATRLYGRFDPIGETWLRRLTPPHPGHVKRIALEDVQDGA